MQKLMSVFAMETCIWLEYEMFVSLLQTKPYIYHGNPATIVTFLRLNHKPNLNKTAW